MVVVSASHYTVLRAHRSVDAADARLTLRDVDVRQIPKRCTTGEEATPTVLVVDDDAGVRSLFVRVLNQRDYRTIEAATGTAALALLAEHDVDAVLLDNVLPDMSGLSLLTALRADAATSTLPVLLVTGRSAVADRIDGLSAGADDYLTKPVNLDELVARIDAQLRGRDAWREQIATRGRERVRLAAELADLPGSSFDEIAQHIAGTLAAVPHTRAVTIIEPPDGSVARVLARAAAEQGGEAASSLDAELMSLVAGLVPNGGGIVSVPADHLAGRTRAASFVAAVVDADEQGPFVVMIEADLRAGDRRTVLPVLLSQTMELVPVIQHLLRRAGARPGNDPVRATLRYVIEQRAFAPVFQPIRDLTSLRTVGYEALTRFSDGVAPDVRFADARRLDMSIDLERATLSAALAAAAQLPHDRYVSVNVSATLLNSGELGEILRTAGHRSLSIELTEHERIDDYQSVRDVVSGLGGDVRLSVDDAGSGWASLRHVFALRPHFIKLDRTWVAGIDADPARKALLLGITRFVAELGGAVIAEGIETAAELQALQELGIEFGQGYLLGRPMPLGAFHDD